MILEVIKLRCPLCGNEENVVKNGHKIQTGSQTEKIKHQRYKCKDCGITFYDENGYYKGKGKSDIRVKLLGIILKHSNIDLKELNRFFGYVENSSEISAWERNIIGRDIIDQNSPRLPYTKSHSHSFCADEITTKKDLVQGIERCSAKKGIFIALKDDCSISYVDVFDESI